MNMNIGKWIVVAFVLFAAFIATLVTICIRQDISLVSKEYYKEELDYQHQMERLANTAALEKKPDIKVVDHKLQVTFSYVDKVEIGELKLFCPSNAKMDKTYTIEASDQPVRFFELPVLQKGMYRAKLFWRMDGKEFYQEEIIYI
jgi:hypothetical protein